MIDWIIHWWIVRQSNAATVKMVKGLLRLADDWQHESKHKALFETDQSFTSDSLGLTLCWVKRNSYVETQRRDMKLVSGGREQAIPAACIDPILKDVNRILKRQARATRERVAVDAEQNVAQWVVDNERVLRKTELRKNLGYDPVPRLTSGPDHTSTIIPSQSLVSRPEAVNLWEGKKIVEYLPAPDMYRLEDGTQVDAETIRCEAKRQVHLLTA